MAEIGSQLLQPEKGWKRYNDSDKNISYIGKWNKYEDFQYSNDITKRIKFNFTGTKIRILSYVHNSYSSNIKILIDEIEYHFAENIHDVIFNCLVFENIELTDNEHYVEIFTNNTDYLNLDSIDIDENKTLKPYNSILSTYLIKQNSNYYSLKSSIYELGQPKDTKEKEQWYKENGIDDLNVLVEKKNNKTVNLKLDKNDIYKTITLINLNEISDKIEFIDKNNKKEIKYNTEDYQLLDLIKKKMGSKFEMGRWGKNKGV